MKVVILCTARTPQLLYGSTLAFKSLRVGFSNAFVEVHDNASHPDCSEQIKRHAFNVGAQYIAIAKRTTHHQWIHSVLKNATGTIVLLDPDCVFFDKMEDMELSGLLTGRLCPAYFNEVVGCNEVERLHTCLLFVRDAKELREKLAAVNVSERYPFDPISPRITARKGKLWFADTFATAFGLIGGKAITSEYLSRFAHLVSGSMIDLVAPKMTEGKELAALHRQAYLNQNVLRDCWANHDKFYASHKPI